MSKQKSSRSELPKNVTPFWRDRGYRPDIADTAPIPGEDPTGEAAYQRAFSEAAKYKPPRLPNPSHYPNSPSAREYMRKKSMDFLTKNRGEKRPAENAPDPQQVARKQRDPDRSPLLPGMKSSSTSPASNYSQNASIPPTLPSMMSTPRAEQYPPGQYSLPPPPMPLLLPTPPRLGVLEPRGAPSGPINKLR